MTLCIGVKSEFGIALGSDSVVSQLASVLPASPGVLSKVALKAVDAVGEFMTAQEQGRAPVNPKVVVDKIITGCMENAEKLTMKTFRSRKVHPMYKRGSHYWGGMLCAGDYHLSTTLARFGSAFDATELDFPAYLDMLLVNLRAVYVGAEEVARSGHFVFACYSRENMKYQWFTVEVDFDPARESAEQFQTVIRDCGDQCFIPIGNTEVVDRLILGSAPVLSSALKERFSEILMPAFAALVPGQRFGDVVVSDANKWLSLIDSATQIDLSAILSRVEKNGWYDRANDTIRLAALVVLAKDAFCEDVKMSIRTGVSIDHISVMSPRECLQVIRWLIDSTAQFQAYIANRIPDVGGDIYLATITAEEGFKFRNLSDNF